MDVPGSEQTPAQSTSTAPVEILPTPTTIYSMHSGLWQKERKLGIPNSSITISNITYMIW